MEFSPQGFNQRFDQRLEFCQLLNLHGLLKQWHQPQDLQYGRITAGGAESLNPPLLVSPGLPDLEFVSLLLPGHFGQLRRCG